ncbi:MAG: hypothetical protein PHC99_05550 [Methylococcales bacterium]|nr:hypothetical protein [Methylococcales bacterium]
MTKEVSAQVLLNGQGFNDAYMIDKAERELNRLKSCSNVNGIYDHIMNFSFTIASISDWIFHIKLANEQKWLGKKEVNFTYWVRSKSAEVSMFIDISNECKHCDKDNPNFYAEKILIYPIWCQSDFSEEQQNFFKKKGLEVKTINNTGENKNLSLIPVIEYNNGTQHYLYDLADAALSWWKNIDVNEAVPMDKNFNELQV